MVRTSLFRFFLTKRKREKKAIGLLFVVFFRDKSESPQKRINSCSSIFFKNIPKMSFFNRRMNAHSAPQSIGVNDDFSQTMSDAYFPQSVQNRTLDGVVSAILPSCSFLYPNGDAGLVQSFIVLD